MWMLEFQGKCNISSKCNSPSGYGHLLPVVYLLEKTWFENNITRWDVLQTKFFYCVQILPVETFKWRFFSQWISLHWNDMWHHSVDVLLTHSIKWFSLWNESSNVFIVLFNTPFLLGSSRNHSRIHEICLSCVIHTFQ